MFSLLITIASLTAPRDFITNLIFVRNVQITAHNAHQKDALTVSIILISIMDHVKLTAQLLYTYRLMESYVSNANSHA